MANLWLEFGELLPKKTMAYGQVLSHEAGNISRVQIPSGEVIRIFNQGVAVNTYCWFQNGRIIGEAPAMTSYSEEV